jgi:hypothetical protein
MPYMDREMAIAAMQERTEKRCQSCRNILPLDDFHADRSRGDGHDYRCKACAAEHAKAKKTVLKTRKPGAGRKPLPADQSKNKQITLRLPPDLYDYLKSLPPGSAERILREHHTRSLTA